MGARRISPPSFSEEKKSSKHPLFTIHKAPSVSLSEFSMIRRLFAWIIYWFSITKRLFFLDNLPIGCAPWESSTPKSKYLNHLCWMLWHSCTGTTVELLERNLTWRTKKMAQMGPCLTLLLDVISHHLCSCPFSGLRFLCSDRFWEGLSNFTVYALNISRSCLKWSGNWHTGGQWQWRNKTFFQGKTAQT